MASSTTKAECEEEKADVPSVSTISAAHIFSGSLSNCNINITYQHQAVYLTALLCLLAFVLFVYFEFLGFYCFVMNAEMLIG